MKRIYLLLVATLVAMAGRAQNSMHTQLGIFGGISLNNQIDHYEGFSYSNKIKTGMTGGLLLNIPISCRLRLEPGLMFVQKGGQQETSASFAERSGTIHAEYKDKLTLNYMELPLLLIYRFHANKTGGFVIGAGAYGAMCMEAHTTHKYSFSGNGEIEALNEKGSYSLNIGDENGDQIYRFDAGARGMLGFQFRKGVFLRASTDLGLMNIVSGDNINGLGATEPHTPQSDPILKNISYQFTLGYMFK